MATYDRNGRILQEFKDLNVINSPRGLAIASKGFSSFKGCLLVTNFGDGPIERSMWPRGN